ncbi:MAG: hypothetical protein WCK25_06280, partial [Actinomycetes bacterium]
NRVLNCRLDDTTLVCQMRKPFDVLVEGLLVSSNRGDWTPIELFGATVENWPTTIQRLLLAA